MCGSEKIINAAQLIVKIVSFPACYDNVVFLAFILNENIREMRLLAFDLLRRLTVKFAL